MPSGKVFRPQICGAVAHTSPVTGRVEDHPRLLRLYTDDAARLAECILDVLQFQFRFHENGANPALARAVASPQRCRAGSGGAPRCVSRTVSGNEKNLTTM